MIKRKARVNAFLIYLADIALAIISFYLAYLIRDSFMPSYARLAPLAQYQWLLLFLIPVWSLTFYIAGGYRFSYKSALFKELIRVWLAIAVSIVLLAFVVFMFKSIYFSRLFLAVFAVVALVCTTCERIIASWYLKKIRVTAQNVRNVIIVGTGERAEGVAEKIRNHKGWGLNFIGYVSEEVVPGDEGRIKGPCLGSIGEIEDIVRRHVVNEVIFVISKERLESLEDVFLFLEDEGINARLELNLFKHVIAKVHLDELDDVPLLTYSTVPTNELALAVKRVLDVVISVVALIALFPVIGLIVALIRLTSNGPALFDQNRCGLNGRHFRLYKFRSMYIGTEDRKRELDSHNELDGPVFKMKRDPRVTPIGRFLRRSSLDELPQLYNVLKGDMSIVGPRPPLPEEVSKYERWQRRRLSMKPGLTCLWQVSGRNAIRFQDWI
jgi:exopolysaccharide biosynthesis polyprenyl glycosylphosphotransferase